MTNKADYDAPRRPVTEFEDDDLGTIRAQTSSAQSPAASLDEVEPVEGIEPPGAEAIDDELTAPVVPMRSDEFRCSRCFLIHHRTQLAGQNKDGDVCRDCA